jgi:hypothetical protein
MMNPDFTRSTESITCGGTGPVQTASFVAPPLVHCAQPHQATQLLPPVAAATPSYKQLIFGHEDEHHTHWDPRRTSVVRIAMLQAIFRLLQRSFLQHQPQQQQHHQQQAQATAASTNAGLLKVAEAASSLEQQVYGLHATPHTYAALLRSRSTLRATLVHVHEVQDKVRFLRRLLKRFSHYMHCAGCSRRGCREFRLLGDHAVECESVRALLLSGQRVPCTSTGTTGCCHHNKPPAPTPTTPTAATAGLPRSRGSSGSSDDSCCSVPSDDGEDADTEDGSDDHHHHLHDEAKSADKQQAHCSSSSSGGSASTPPSCPPPLSPGGGGGGGEDADVARHCDILKSVLFHNVSCDRHSCRVCGDLGSVLPWSLATAAASQPGGEGGNLMAMRSLCRKRAAEHRRQQLLLQQPSSPLSVTAAPSALLAPPSLPSCSAAAAAAKQTRELSIISEESCYSCSEVEDECASSCHDIDDGDYDYDGGCGSSPSAASSAALRKLRKLHGFSKPLKPRPFLSELRSRSSSNSNSSHRED